MSSTTSSKKSSSVPGDPQLLLEKIVRMRVRESRFWKEHCFGLSAERLVDKAVETTCVGGVASESNRPTPFICLVLKMLQLDVDIDVVCEFVRNEEFKYVRCLGAFYLRLVATPLVIYMELEPLLSDYRKIAMHTRTSWETSTVDQFLETLLYEKTCCGIALPFLPKRQSLVDRGIVEEPLRESALRDEFETLFGDQFESEEEEEEPSSKRVKT